MVSFLQQINMHNGLVLIFLYIVYAISPTMLIATEIYVDDSGGSDYTTIQAAVTAATAGDTIIVKDGTYTENIDVTKQLVIQSENGYSSTVVKASNTSDHVFYITANNVKISGFDVYKAGYQKAGVAISANSCTISDNRLGYDSSNKNYYGVYVTPNSISNTISGNSTSYSERGIYLERSNDSTVISNNTINSSSGTGIYIGSSMSDVDISGNTSNSNFEVGILLGLSINNTIIWGNTVNSQHGGINIHSSNNLTISGNICNSNSLQPGIKLHSVDNSMISGNNCNSNQGDGIQIANSSNNIIIAGNTLESNGRGITPGNSNRIYLNKFSSTTNVNSSATNTWNSATKIYYDYTGGSMHKNYMGNYYSDHTLTDTDGDGITDSNYSPGGWESDDEYPLANTPDKYSLQAWWINSDTKMYRNDMSKKGGTVLIDTLSSKIWIAGQAALTNISFSGGSGQTWTGQIVFTSAPTSGHTFKVEIGYSTNGSDFTAGGPDATLTGNGSNTVFTYETDASAFTMITGKYLALKITNNNVPIYSVRTGGGWSYTSSPQTSTDYSLPVELTSFTADNSRAGEITLNWVTESEIENLGFILERGAESEDGTTAEWTEIASYITDESLRGQGSVTYRTEYSFTDKTVEPGVTYDYRLADVSYAGEKVYHALNVLGVAVTEIPEEFALFPAYPNPFNPETVICYQLSADSDVSLKIYDVKGQMIETLLNKTQDPGFYKVNWKPNNLPSGVYFCKLTIGDRASTQKLILLK